MCGHACRSGVTPRRTAGLQYVTSRQHHVGSSEGRPRWYELLPEFVLATGLAVFLFDEPDAATSAFKSGRAVGLMAAAAVAWVVARVVLSLLVPWRLVRTALFGIAAVAALAVVVLPAYDDETVVEAFPTPSSTDMVEATSTTAAATATPATPTAVDAPATTTPAPVTPTTTLTTTTTTTAMVAAPSGPVRLRMGAFMGIDHRATGTVSIYRAPDGTHVVGLEEFDIQPGPDYDVYIVPGTDRDDPDGGTRLDDLRGNQGTQYYGVPAEVDVTAGEWTVLIWCQTFGVPVANATPA